MAKGHHLTERQARFCQEYLIDLNGTRAAERAGYSAKTAASQAERLLRNVEIQARVSALQAERSRRTEIEADRVVKELALSAFSDIGDVMDFSAEDVRLRPAREIPEAARRAIASIKSRRYTEGKGDDALTVEVTEFKLCDKLSALDKLARHLGMYVDRHEHSGPGGKPIPVKVDAGLSLTADSLRACAALVAAAGIGVSSNGRS